MRVGSRNLSIAVVCLSAMILAVPITAETAAGEGCPLPISDNLESAGTCCITGLPNIPWHLFPGATDDCPYVTWTDCNLKVQQTATLTLGPPISPLSIDPGDGGRAFELGNGMAAIPLAVTAGAESRDVFAAAASCIEGEFTVLTDPFDDNVSSVSVFGERVVGAPHVGNILVSSNFENVEPPPE